MAKFFGKKNLLLGTLVVALGVAVYLNYYFADQTLLLPNTDNPTTQSTAPDKELGDAMNVNSNNVSTGVTYFNEAKANRQKSREEATALIKEVLNDVKATDEQKEAVAIQVAAMAKAVEQESKVEELIKAKGYTDCVVYIEDDRCSVVVQSDGLTVQDTAKISQIVTAQTDIFAQNINIIAVKS